MAAILFSRYRNTDLKELTTRLNEDYYEVLRMYCLNASGLAARLQNDKHHASTSLYTSLAAKLIEQIESLIRLRQQVILPYVSDLSVKKDEGHDCRNCTGSCHVGHNANLMSLKDSHKRIKEILFRLQSVALPLYTEADYPASYKMLRNEMTVIDTALTELFYLEEANLIPRVLEAQRSIHA
ncbi:MAG: hypothetical protein KDC11_03600 [Chitinophagaceae bacterium]|nr:hypothetical protein [Chitinophagaceae bacterium]